MFLSLFNGISIGIIVCVVIGLVTIAVIIFFFLHQNKVKRKSALSSKENEVYFESRLHDDGFKICQTATVLSSKIYIDDQHKLWALKTGNKSFYHIYPFAKLLGYEQSIYGTNINLHINIDDPEHSTRSLRFESDDYSLDEKENLISKIVELLQYILDNK